MGEESTELIAQLIQNGQTAEAQARLKPILEADVHNIQAWLLQAQLCKTIGQKKAVLELALRINPEAVELKEAQKALATQPSAETISTSNDETAASSSPENGQPILRNLLLVAICAALAVMAYLYKQPLICSLQLKQAPCTHILFIGNSYTYVNDLPGTFSALAWAGGHVVETDMAASGGWTLDDHEHSAGTLAKISSTQWDWTVLQEQSELPAMPQERNESMFPAARELVKQVKADGAKPIFLLTWAHRDGLPEAGLTSYAQMQDQLNQAYLQIGRELDAPVAPAGPAWSAAMRQDKQLQLWQSDGSHPSPQGTYLAACVLYAALFRQSPVGLRYTDGLSAAIALELQTAAADTVLNSPQSWGLQ